MGFKAGAQNTSEAFRKAAAAALFLLVSTLLVACDGGDGGLSRADVEEIVREELADAPARPEPASDISSVEVEAAIRAALAGIPQQEPWLSRDEVEQLVGAAIPSLSTPQPGLTSAQLQEAIRTALAAIPQPQPGLTSTEAEKIARDVVASIPPRSAPAEYTRFFVSNAISRYETEGLDATLVYYNRGGERRRAVVRVHRRRERPCHRTSRCPPPWAGPEGLGWHRTPPATTSGRTCSQPRRRASGCPMCTNQNPESGGLGSDHTGALEYKHVWTVRHDGLLFTSGWYVSADEYTRFVVDEAIAHYHAEGVDDALAYYNNPDSADAQWYVFVATPEGEVLGHYNAEDLGVHLEEMLGDGSFTASADGAGVTHEDVNPVTGEVEDKHFWLVEHDGLVFGSGWHHDETKN